MRIERASVYESIQLGLETTPGTLVAANRQLLGLTELSFDKQTDIKPFMAQGFKFDSTATIGKEQTSGRLQGVCGYNDLLYLLSSWITQATPTVPGNNSTWVASTYSDDTLTIGFTFKTVVLAPAAYSTAADFQTAIGGMSSVGSGNVLVTGLYSTGWIIQFIGALSTDVSAIGTVTGTSSATITAQDAGTLTNRWVFSMLPSGPDTVQTFTFEKGVQGQANMGQQAGYAFVEGMSFKFNKSEATYSGQFCGQITTDAFTLTASPAQVTNIPVNPKDVSVYMGTSLNGMTRMDRVLDVEFGIESRANGLMTLNANDTSYSARIEQKPNSTAKMFIEHDLSGQAILADMRAGLPIYTILEVTGPSIEFGFPYRMKFEYVQRITKPNEGDTDGVFGHTFDSVMQYAPDLGTGFIATIDSPLSTL